MTEIPDPSACPAGSRGRARRARSTAVAGALAALLLGGAATAPGAGATAHPPAHRAYVALGDSYSSGVGAGLNTYEVESGECKRNSKAYPALWSAGHRSWSFVSTACAGATTDDVASSQLGPLGRGTGLVSLTAGANDAGFADVMTTCTLGGEKVCLQRVEQARAYADRTLPGKLQALYEKIRGKAPAARVVVLGYPHLYQLHGACAFGLSETERAAVNKAVDAIDEVTARGARRQGFVFADVREAFKDHEVCARSPWLHSVSLPPEESYHPNAQGQSRGYLPVFSRAAG
ncbi:SGNH/GDSL hydrolase family protein [Streptomyces gamaensis]|uniref:SGNH/GDSL hydrolase family protein n=1 Tax=Streptomyces gamaensis TaxID=1763542 RepID=A0ABW0YYG2_9ACTN